jgi:hypothetical protein
VVSNPGGGSGPPAEAGKKKRIIYSSKHLKTMAIVKESPIGVVSGKLGQIAGAKWKGINYLRVIPGSVANPQTVRQLTQRQKFSVTIGFINPIRQFLKIGFKNYAVRMTPANAAFSWNIGNAIQGTYPNFTIDYPNALVSRGEVAPALNQAAASSVAGTIVFTWDDNTGEINGASTDKTLLLVYNPAKNQSVAIMELATRADATQTVTVPDSFSGDLVQCYIAFTDKEGIDVSNSMFAGAVTVI